MHLLKIYTINCIVTNEFFCYTTQIPTAISSDPLPHGIPCSKIYRYLVVQIQPRHTHVHEWCTKISHMHDSAVLLYATPPHGSSPGQPEVPSNNQLSLTLYKLLTVAHNLTLRDVSGVSTVGNGTVTKVVRSARVIILVSTFPTTDWNICSCVCMPSGRLKLATFFHTLFSEERKAA